jgi:2-polyprenyl-6-hydroxyphenyl methylase / 3-demethylubiquinone-9 3-methyltransferase
MKTNTINKKEIEKFSKIAEEWWNPEGKFKPLHKFNPVRISYIKDNIINILKLKNKIKPLKNVKILDVGCGGGLLSEPMSRLGAKVSGIDASEKNIVIAKLHAKKNKLNINYQCTSPEKIISKEKFDVILNMEIVEHVDNIEYFLESCSKLLKKNGIMFVATLNRTLKSYLFAIIGAEYILRWLPIGTHDWEKFVKPEDLVDILKKFDLKLNSIDGIKLDIVKDEWNISSDKSVNYIARFIKS